MSGKNWPSAELEELAAGDARGYIAELAKALVLCEDIYDLEDFANMILGDMEEAEAWRERKEAER